MNKKRILLVAASVVTLSIAIQTLSMRVWGQGETTPSTQTLEQDIPIVDYDNSKTDLPTLQSPADDARRAKSARYDRRRVVRDVDTGGRPVLGFSHWDAALPALPVGRSALILLGEVVETKAYLSNDKTGVYSEFTVRVERVYKNDNSNFVSPGGLITANRWGGRVRFPSGRLVIYGNRGQGMPRPGQEYVFFIERNPQQYSILTAYQLREGRVHPLDGRSALGGESSEWPGNAYEGANDAGFLDEVGRAIAHSFAEREEKGLAQP
jgi:hypothetical protein